MSRERRASYASADDGDVVGELVRVTRQGSVITLTLRCEAGEVDLVGVKEKHALREPGHVYRRLPKHRIQRLRPWAWSPFDGEFDD